MPIAVFASAEKEANSLKRKAANRKNNWQLYGEVQVPVYTLVNGYQLVAPLLFNASISYHF